MGEMSSAARRLRALLLSLLAAVGLALLGAGHANAGQALSPTADTTFEVATDDTGQIERPTTIDLVVQLDSDDTLPRVWVSQSPEIDQFGAPAEEVVDRCDRNQLLPQGEPGKWVCRIDLRSLPPDTTFYWWLEFHHADPGQASPTVRTTEPFDFFLYKVSGPEPPEDPVDVPGEDPHSGVSSKTVAAAAMLPGGLVFNGSRSIKHTTLTRLVYKTMKSFGMPRSLAFACWNQADWLAVLAAEGDEPTKGNSVLLGFWLRKQPRWLHLAPNVCTDVQALLTTRKPNARRAGALSTVIHETLHAYGVSNEAQTNCFAVQLVPFFGLDLGMSLPRARYLGTLAHNYVRGHAPNGYWNGAHCHENGAWDLFRGRNFG